MDLLADYASSDEEEREKEPPLPAQLIPPEKLDKSESDLADEKDEDSLTKSAPNPPKSSLFNSLPPPKSQSFPSPKPKPEVEHRREVDEELAKDPKPKSSSSLFSSLPRPKSSSSASTGAKKVVQFKPPVISNPYSRSLDEDEGEEERKRKMSREKISTSNAASFLSSIPAPRHSATLGVLPSASGVGRRSMLETNAPTSNLRTGSDADANSNVGNSNNHSNDVNYGHSTWGLEGEAPAYYSDNGTTNDGVANPESINYGGYDHSTSLGGAHAASTDTSSVSSAGIDAGVNPNAGSYEAVDYTYSQGKNVDYSSYSGGYGDHGNNLQYENSWGNSTVLPEASGMVENAISVLGKRGRKDVPPEIVEVNQDELMKNRPREDQVKMTGIAFGPAYEPTSTKGKPTKLHKRKHQIGSLYFDMRQKESELAERRARGFQTKAQTQGKYAMDFGASSSFQPAMRVSQGPLYDQSVLFRQEEHRSQFVFNDDPSCKKSLRCTRAEGNIWDFINAASDPTKSLLYDYGFGPVSRIGSILYDHKLITALVERWRPETHTFHLPMGETTITLQDVEVLTGLRVDGEPITGSTAYTDSDLAESCQLLLGFTPQWQDIKDGRLKLTALHKHIENVRVNNYATVEMAHQRARCFILLLLGGLLLVDSTKNRVPLYFLQFLGSPEVSSSMSWGITVLAWLYRCLCTAALGKSKSIYGCLLIVQVWAWERIRTVRPRVLQGNDRIPEWGEALASRWYGPKSLTEITSHNLRGYRDQLAILQESDFVWTPYATLFGSLVPMCSAGHAIWTARTWLICFEVVEMHYPDRVMRQFGFGQSVPRNPVIMDAVRHKKLHEFKKSGRPNVNWRVHWGELVQHWNQRLEYVEHGAGTVDDIFFNKPYMQWYHAMTVIFITNPHTHRQQSSDGFQGAVEGRASQAQVLQQINRITHQRHGCFDVTLLQQMLANIEELAENCLNLGTTQVHYADTSQLFKQYDPVMTQLFRMQNRPQYARPNEPPRQSFRQPRQHPQQEVEEDDEPDDEDTEEDDDDEDEEVEMEGDGDGDEDGDEEPDEESTPSPQQGPRRGSRERRKKKFYGDSSSIGQKLKFFFKR